jgi:UDP-glucose 4-epimerase
MRSILITGVNGLIGSTIAEHLLGKYEVIGTSIEDINMTGLAIKYIKSDITNKATFDQLPEKVDVVVHCAAIITHDNYSNLLLNANCIGVQNIAAYANGAGCERLVYFSSLPIIGKPSIIPITEEHPINPPTVYHVTKYFGEQILNLLMGKKKMVIFRIPSPIGRKTAPNKIVPVFVKNAIENVDYTLLGQGKRIQNYIDVRDIARAVECAIVKNAFGVFNIASEKSYSNKELAELCIELFGSKSSIHYNGIDKEEDYQWIVSTKKAHEVLDFEARYSLIDTLKEIGKNFQK